MPNYKIIDWRHRFAGQIINTERKFLFYELQQTPYEHLINVVNFFGILKNPHKENKLTLINAMIDFMHVKAMTNGSVAI